MENDWLIKTINIPKAAGDFVINHSREHALSKTMYKFKLGKIIYKLLPQFNANTACVLVLYFISTPVVGTVLLITFKGPL